MSRGSTGKVGRYVALAAFLTVSAVALASIMHGRHAEPPRPEPPPRSTGNFSPPDSSQGPAPAKEPEPEPAEEPEPEPEPGQPFSPVPPLAARLPLSKAQIAGLIDSLRKADSFLENDFTRRAGRAAHKLTQAGRPAWDTLAAEVQSQEDEFARARLNAVLACMRWRLSPYFVFELDPNFTGELYTREAPLRGEWFSSLETFLKAKDAPKLVQSFTLNDPEASFYIFDFIEMLGAPALKPLLEALSDEHPYFHFCVTVALMRLAPHTLNELRRLMRDPNAGIRGRAVWALGLSGSRGAVGALTRALGDEAASVRSSAAYMLAMIPDRRAVPHLVKALQDPDSDVASLAACALGVIGDPAAAKPLAEYIKSGMKDAKASGASALAGIGEQSAKALLSLLEDPDEETRAAAANALAELRSASTASGLIDAISDRSVAVRCAAADALGYMHGRGVTRALRKAISDSDAMVRSSAAYALGRLKAADAADALASLLRDEDARVRLSAIGSLGKIGGERALEILIDSLESPELSPLAAPGIKNYAGAANARLIGAFSKASAQAKCTIARLLAESGALTAVPVLIDALADADINVRFCADKALKIITGHETSYKCDAPEAGRAKGQQEWRKWWQQHRCIKKE